MPIVGHSTLCSTLVLGLLNLTFDAPKYRRELNALRRGLRAPVWSPPTEGNAATSSQKLNEPDEDWDIQVSFAVEEFVFFCTTNQKEELALTMISTNRVNYNVDWIIDSGCSNHMTGDKRKITKLIEYKGGLVMVTIDNSRLSNAHIENLFGPLFVAISTSRNMSINKAL
ncbi:hypothetical protein ACH5RR_034540 [Cinchona calisaya]|uniref:Retrovirus-related Pol polyprotein from transposon TNT 1-94-like beta-barrel domain-containing protein n=1 Tax=Cinchona calisaya TaxID=153742 RepID=A0ABD2YF46_9GENT